MIKACDEYIVKKMEEIKCCLKMQVVVPPISAGNIHCSLIQTTHPSHNTGLQTQPPFSLKRDERKNKARN